MVLHTFDELCRAVQDAINESLKSEVADTVQKTMIARIDMDVYRRYSPADYIRRKENGGLSDPKNIVSDLVSDGVLEVENGTEFNTSSKASRDHSYRTENYGWELSGLIEYGDGWNGYFYDYPFENRGYMEPRPFIANTRKQLEQSKDYVKALKQGLKSQGIQIK